MDNEQCRAFLERWPNEVTIVHVRNGHMRVSCQGVQFDGVIISTRVAEGGGHVVVECHWRMM